MQVKRQYQPRNLHWRLLPDLIQKVMAFIPVASKVSPVRLVLDPFVKRPLLAKPRYEISTYSQTVSVDSGVDFLSFIEKRSEQPIKADIFIACYTSLSDGDLLENRLPYFHLSWRADRVTVTVARNNSESALAILHQVESLLQLQATAAPLRSEDKEGHTLKRTVFVAHPFDDSGRAYAFQLTRFLNAWCELTTDGYTEGAPSR
jgi:hypothetical protein